jgi:hypothetical protein
LSKQRHSASRWLLILTLACVVLLGFYIGHYEVDQKPTPRALLNLGGLYYERGDTKLALTYWRECADYNEIYNTKYRLDTFPEGQRIKACKQNLFNHEKLLKLFKTFKNDPLFHRGKNK